MPAPLALDMIFDRNSKPGRNTQSFMLFWSEFDLNLDLKGRQEASKCPTPSISEIPSEWLGADGFCYVDVCFPPGRLARLVAG